MSKYRLEKIQSERHRNVTADNVKERLKYERYYKVIQKQLRKENQLRSHLQTKFREQQTAKLGIELALKQDTKQPQYQHKGSTNSNAKNYVVQMISEEASSTKLELKNAEPSGNRKKNFPSRQSTSFSDHDRDDILSPVRFVDSQTGIKCVKHCVSFPRHKHRTIIKLSNQKACRCLSAEPSLPTINSGLTKNLSAGKVSSSRFPPTITVKSHKSAGLQGTSRFKSNLLYTSSKQNQQCDNKNNENLLHTSRPAIMLNHKQTDTHVNNQECRTDKVSFDSSEEPNKVVRKHLNEKPENIQPILRRRSRLQEVLQRNNRQERVDATIARKFDELDQIPQETPKSSKWSDEAHAKKSKTVTWMDTLKPLNSIIIKAQSTDNTLGPSSTSVGTRTVKYGPIGQPITCAPVRGDFMSFKHKMPKKKKRNHVFHPRLNLSKPARFAAGKTSDSALLAR